MTARDLARAPAESRAQQRPLRRTLAGTILGQFEDEIATLRDAKSLWFQSSTAHHSSCTGRLAQHQKQLGGGTHSNLITHHGRVKLIDAIGLAAFRGLLNEKIFHDALAALDEDFE